MSKEEKLVVIVRLDASKGFFHLADALEVVGQLQEQGINAICEQAPAALMDLPDAYFLKVPESQQGWAIEALKGILSKRES